MTNTMEQLNTFILQQVIKKRSCHAEGSVSDQKKQREHFKTLVQCIHKVSNGQASMSYNDDDFCKFDVRIQPNDGPYKGGSLLFHFKLRPAYPTSPPQIMCGNTVYHPNIDDEGDICLSVLSEWSGNNNDLLDCIQGLLYFLHYPNLDDPLSPYFAPGEDTNGFHENIKFSMQGGCINGIQFDNILS